MFKFIINYEMLKYQKNADFNYYHIKEELWYDSTKKKRKQNNPKLFLLSFKLYSSENDKKDKRNIRSEKVIIIITILNISSITAVNLKSG